MDGTLAEFETYQRGWSGWCDLVFPTSLNSHGIPFFPLLVLLHHFLDQRTQIWHVLLLVSTKNTAPVNFGSMIWMHHSHLPSSTIVLWGDRGGGVTVGMRLGVGMPDHNSVGESID